MLIKGDKNGKAPNFGFISIVCGKMKPDSIKGAFTLQKVAMHA